MKASQLRDLTRKYAAGNMDRQVYLAERTRLIDGIVSGEIEVRYRELEASAKPAGKDTQKHWLFAGGTVMLIGLLLVALLFHFLDDGAADADTAARAEQVSPPEPGVQLVDGFLRHDDWSEAKVRQLEADWNSLTPFQQESARRSAGFRRLRHELAQRVGEQEALLAAGEMEALLHAKRLRDFAMTLGIEMAP